MSAICGVVHRDRRPVTPPIMERMMTALDAYGPDGSAIWQEGSAALGHQMLHTTPESLHETLPWQEGLTGLVITADARLDNREDLYVLLTIPPHVGQALSDAQLILRAYIKWGEQCPQHLLGDFAFVIWDARKQQLFCARDIFGIKPFFYYGSFTSFIFASDLKALLAISEVPRQFNKTLLAAYLQQEDIMFAKKSLTFYDKIYKLPPAHCLTLTPDKQEISCYWSPQNVPQIRLKSEVDYQDMVKDLLEKAIRCRLRSAFPIGAHLSGGLDSSSVAVVAARLLQSKGQILHGFSWSPPTTFSVASSKDERSLVKEICRREGIECQYISLTGQDMLTDRIRNFMTEPTEMLHAEQKIQSNVASQNIRVMLSGWGGDEAITFNGRGYFSELFLTGNWWTLYREFQQRNRLHGLGWKSEFLKKVLVPLLPDRVVTRLEALTNADYRPAGHSAYIRPQLAKKVQPQIEKLPKLCGIARERGSVRTNQQMLLDYGHLTNRIEDWTISGGQHQLVYSYPLLDRRIVEFALGVPADLFFKHGWKRYLFRTSMDNILPDAVRWNKTKQDPAAFAHWDMCQDDMLKTWTDRTLIQLEHHRQSSILNEWLDVDQLATALTGKEPPKPGFRAAVNFVNAFAEISSQRQPNDAQTASMA